MHKKTIVRRATEAFCAWTADESPAARLERTVAQGAVAALAVGVTTGEWGAATLTALAMAVISPVQAMLAKEAE